LTLRDTPLVDPSSHGSYAFGTLEKYHMRILMSAVIALCGLTMPIAGYSSASAAEDNYARLDKAERAACIKASGFLKATVSPKTYGFSDQVGWDIRLVSGTYPQRHMKGARGQMLCAYRRGTGRVEVQEFGGW
jgi:hypothetical protein